MMNAKPYELILLRLDENADVEAVKASGKLVGTKKMGQLVVEYLNK